ncbi:hypothetical protein MMC07_009963 [Pseudocyphellaria aurata]|nr:hypothetical protein [Pseudocyphellaria aurata]
MVQLSHLVQIQSEPTKVSCEKSDQNNKHTHFNHGQQTDFGQPLSIFRSSAFQKSPAPPAGPTYTRSDMSAPASSYQMQPSHPFRRYGLVSPERSQKLPASTYETPPASTYHKPAASSGALHPNPSYFTYAPMSNKDAAAAQSSAWSADTIGPSTQAGLSAMSSVLTNQDQSSRQLTWSGVFTRFFGLTQDWAKNYTNAPIMANDLALPAALIKAFANHSDPNHVMDLLCSSATRYLLIAKMLNVWLTADVFQPHKTRGLCPRFDKQMDRLRNQIHPNLSPKLRHILFKTMIDAAKQRISTKEFQRDIECFCMEKISSLWDRLSYLFAPGISRRQAWNDLQYVFVEAYRIAVLMECTTLRFGIVYPPLDKDKFFQPQCMINRDFAYKEGPYKLRDRGVRVCLGISPVVVATDFSASTVETVTVHFASVLLME